MTVSPCRSTSTRPATVWVDGAPVPGRVGTLGAGGKGYFVLDVTDPTNFIESKSQQLVVKDRTRGNGENAPDCNRTGISADELLAMLLATASGVALQAAAPGVALLPSSAGARPLLADGLRAAGWRRAGFALLVARDWVRGESGLIAVRTCR